MGGGQGWGASAVWVSALRGEHPLSFSAGVLLIWKAESGDVRLILDTKGESVAELKCSKKALHTAGHRRPLSEPRDVGAGDTGALTNTHTHTWSIFVWTVPENIRSLTITSTWTATLNLTLTSKDQWLRMLQHFHYCHIPKHEATQRPYFEGFPTTHTDTLFRNDHICIIVFMTFMFTYCYSSLLTSFTLLGFLWMHRFLNYSILDVGASSW